MNIIKFTRIFLFAALVISAGACSSPAEKSTTKSEIVPLQVQVESPSSNNDYAIGVSGQVESIHTAELSTRVMGYITAIKVKAGDKVSKGQLLITISNDDVMAKLAQADAMLSSANAVYASAQKDLQRFSNLYNQKSASAKELDNVTLQHQSAKANVRAAAQAKAEARAMLAYTNITAPFSGIVSKKLADAGSMANPGMPILVIEQSGNLQVNAAIPETEISRVQLHSPASVSIESLNRQFSGEVVEISPSSMGTGGQFLVKISLPEEAQNVLSSGMYANVKIKTDGKTASKTTATVLVPINAISRIGQLDAIYTVSNRGTALLRYVRLGKQYGDKVEILSGLNDTETFITKANGKLYNGAPVSITTQKYQG